MPEKSISKPDRFCVQRNLSRYPADGDTHIVHNSLPRSTHIVPNLHIRLAESCQNFATIEQHAAQLCNEFGFGALHFDSTKQILEELVLIGLLSSEQDIKERFLNALKEGVDTRDTTQISSIGIPTRERLDELDRCIGSYAQVCGKYNRQLDFVIADQAQDRRVRDSTIDLLARHKKNSELKFFYIGVEEKQNFAAQVAAQSGLPLDVVSFALCNVDKFPIDTGINRNALLLSTLGRLCLQVDDDSICRLMPAPRVAPGLSIDSRFNVYQYWFPTEEDIAKLPDSCVEQNIFAIHEQLLGQRLSACAGDGSSSAVELLLDNASTNLLRSAQERLLAELKETAAVAVTSIGVAGDSGVGTSHYYLTLAGAERERLLASMLQYKYSMEHLKVIRTVQQNTISDTAFCSSLNLGLDNRRLLPPFLPVQRGQDCVFTNVLHVCAPSAMVGFLPAALLHKQKSSAPFSVEDFRRKLLYRTSGEIVERLVTGLAPKPTRISESANMTALGEALVEWGTAPLADFENQLRKIIWEEMCRMLFSLRQALAHYNGHPKFWADDVERALSWLSEGFTDEDLVVASDLRMTFGAQEARTRMQRLVKRFGELIRAWPTMRQSVVDLYEREIFLPIEV